MSIQILSTKLFIPPYRQGLVVRSQLIDQLNQGLARKLILISAPAGYGKTTLLSEWVHRKDIPCSWISLDEGDNDPGRFLAYIFACLQSIHIVVDSQLLAFLQNPKEYPLETVLIPLINQVTEDGRSFCMVLDDYHHIHDEGVHNVLSFIIDHQPPNMSLVVSTRADPALPLARLRARGQILELRAAHLRLSVEDIDLLLNQIKGLNLSDQDINRLAARTDGWAAGVQMVSIALEGKPHRTEYISDLSASQDYIADFLTEEVYNQQPEAVQRFLLQTSLVDRFCASLCDSITAGNDAVQILRLLRDRNLFLIPLDDQNQWFRYHRLFADLNSQRFLELHPEEVPLVYLRASLWFEEHGYRADAVDYAFRANSIERAVELVDTQVEDLFIRSELATFIRWMRKLPDEIIFKRPKLCIYYAWVLLVSRNEPESAAIYLDRVVPLDRQTKGQVDTVKSILAFYQRQIPEALERSRQALQELPEDDLFFRQIASWSLSAMLFVSGDREAGAEILAETARVSLASGNYLVAVIALCRQGSYHVLKGNLHQAKHLFEQALDIASPDLSRRLPVACEPLLGLGMVYWEWNQLKKAFNYLKEGVGLSALWRETAVIDNYLILAHINQSWGDAEGADRMIKAAKEAALKTRSSNTDDRYVASGEAYLRLRQGDLKSVQEWASHRAFSELVQDTPLDIPPAAGQDIILRYELLVYARFLLMDNQAEVALSLLDKLRFSFEQLGYQAKVLESLILSAEGMQRLGKVELAESTLQKALALAEPSGYVRLFVDQSLEFSRLLKRIKKPLSFSILAQKLGSTYEVIESISEPRDLDRVSIDSLSQREREILRLLVSDLTVPEIADQSYITVSTLRTHIRNIYSKLDVHSRFEAVSKARELHLI